MKPDIRMIALDLDGTLLTSEKTISPRSLRAIQQALAAGIAVLPATGRQRKSIPAEFLKLPGVRYAITANGARIYDGETVLAEGAFSDETALSILQQAREYPLFLSLYSGDQGYAEGDDFTSIRSVVESKIFDYIEASRSLVPNAETLIGVPGNPIDKFAFIFFDEATRQKAWAAFAHRGDCIVSSSIPMNIELNAVGTTKGSALLRLAETLGIPRESVMAVGDNVNDLDMLRAAGWAVAMGNAEPEVQHLADTVTASNDQDGVAKAIEAVLP